MILSIIFLINGVICGIILLQTLVVAPSVFKSLGELHAGPFLRSLFPKFFIVLSVLGLIGAILSILNGINLTFFIDAQTMIHLIKYSVKYKRLRLKKPKIALTSF